MERKLGICNSCLLGIPGSAEELKLIKNAGFDMFFSGSYEQDKVYMQKNEGDKIGLSLDFLHAPFSGINSFWLGDLEYLNLWKKVKQSIDSASSCNIPTVVMHVSSGWTPPPLSDIGFSRFDKLVEYAIEKNVNIAFENLRKVGNLAAIMERYERIPNVGFCYDCGHEHCYTETVRFFDLYGKRTICTHIHDNLGRDKEDPLLDADYHWLPFEGDINYKEMIDLMDKYDYHGPLTLEVGQYGKFKDLTAEEFLATCYERLKRIADMSEKED